MQRGAELDALANDFAFLQGDHRRCDFNMRFRPRAHPNQFLKDAIIFRAAIWIAGAVFRDCADVDGLSADNFSPASCYGKEMRVAKRHVSNGYFAGASAVRNLLMFRDCDAPIRKGGAADGSKMIELNNQPVLHMIKIRDGFERLPFAVLRPLSVTGVQQRNVLRAMCLYRNGGTYA